MKNINFEDLRSDYHYEGIFTGRPLDDSYLAALSFFLHCFIHFMPYSFFSLIPFYLDYQHSWISVCGVIGCVYENAGSLLRAHIDVMILYRRHAIAVKFFSL